MTIIKEKKWLQINSSRKVTNISRNSNCSVKIVEKSSNYLAHLDKTIFFFLVGYNLEKNTWKLV